MSEIKINAMLGALQRQRDAALTEVVVLRGELAELQAQIARLSERPADSKHEAEGP